jgi:FMN phosphatase YigB (HAD superfamily)
MHAVILDIDGTLLNSNEIDDMLYLTSDDYPDRQSIMVHALNQLRGVFQTVTYYGDGAWDEAASRNLGWKFVPVGERLGGLTRFNPVGA